MRMDLRFAIVWIWRRLYRHVLVSFFPSVSGRKLIKQLLSREHKKDTQLKKTFHKQIFYKK